MTGPQVPTAATTTSRSMRWWGRLLLVLLTEGVLFAAYALEARPATFRSSHPPWPTYVFCAVLLVVVIQGAARFKAFTWGMVWLLGSLAAFSGVAGAVPQYVSHVGEERSVTVVQADREVVRGTGRIRGRDVLRSYSVAQVRIDGEGATRTAYLRGNWSEAQGRRTTVREDPLGIAGLQSASPLHGLSSFWFVVWVPSFVVLQLGLLAIVFRRGPSLMATGGEPAT